MDPDDEMPRPVEIVDDDYASESVYGEELDPTSEVGAATLWFLAMDNPEEYANAIDQLTWDSAVFGDFSEAASLLRGRSVAGNVERPDDHADEVAYVKFVPDMGHSVQAFGEVPLDDVVIVTLRWHTDGRWLVCKLSHNEFPDPIDVLT